MARSPQASILRGCSGTVHDSVNADSKQEKRGRSVIAPERHSPAGYERIKRQANDLGLTIPDLLALARQNDPFFSGSPAQQKKAKWFAELWRRFGYARGVHLRRVHYQLVTQHRPRTHDGKPYENTDACWHLLSDAGKLARYLGLVAPDAFVDQRNPDPHVFAQPASGVAVGWSVGELPSWSLPAIRADLADCLDLELSDCYVEGYDYSLGDEPYLLELWIEKTTQNDVLVQLCRHHGIIL